MNNTNQNFINATPLNKINTSQPFPAMKQEEKNRKMLEELKRQKLQMMSKNASASNRPTNLHPTGPISSSSDKDVSISSGSGTSTTATSRVNLSEGTGTIMFLPVNSQFGNSIIPVFPRISSET